MIYIYIYIYIYIFSNIYRGTAAFSEPETKAVRDFIMNQKQNQTFVVSFLYHLCLYAYRKLIKITVWVPNNFNMTLNAILDVFDIP